MAFPSPELLHVCIYMQKNSVVARSHSLNVCQDTRNMAVVSDISGPDSNMFKNQVSAVIIFGLPGAVISALTDS